MRFIDFKNFGPPEVLFLNETLFPKAKAEEVVIQVKAAGVNRPDLFQRMGLYPPPLNANSILGLEVSGIIVEKGKNANLWKIGDHVCALTNGGGYAEFCAVPENQCLPIPPLLNYIEAASLPETYFTVWSNVFERGLLREDETILIHAGASGIGSTAIQLAKAFRAKVITTTSSNIKASFCEQLHADLVINYHLEDFVEKALEATKSKGVDLILDIIGGEYFIKNISLLSEEGRLIQISCLKGNKVQLDLHALMRKRLLITGSTLRPQSNEAKAKIATALKEKVWPLFINQKLKTHVYATFSLQDAAKAHALLETNQVCGKVVLVVSES